MSLKITRGLLIFWCFFIGIGAIFGSSGMIYDPSGKLLQMTSLLPYFQKLPFADIFFKNLLFPGIALLIVNGFTQLTTALLLLRKNKFGAIAGISCGIILMLWISIQFYIFPANFMSTTYFIFGLLEAMTGILVYIKEKKVKKQI